MASKPWRPRMATITRRKTSIHGTLCYAGVYIHSKVNVLPCWKCFCPVMSFNKPPMWEHSTTCMFRTKTATHTQPMRFSGGSQDQGVSSKKARQGIELEVQRFYFWLQRILTAQRGDPGYGQEIFSTERGGDGGRVAEQTNTHRDNDRVGWGNCKKNPWSSNSLHNVERAWHRKKQKQLEGLVQDSKAWPKILSGFLVEFLPAWR